MKKTLIALILVTLMPYGAVFAQQKADTTPAPAPVVAPEKPLTLTEKKAKAEGELRALEAQFRLFIGRTQVTIDRLSTKDIDTTKAQVELTAALADVDAAKASLDLFAKIAISDDMTEEQVEKSGIKPALIKIQDTLKSARTHLIESLTLLKSSVTLTITQ